MPIAEKLAGFLVGSGITHYHPHEVEYGMGGSDKENRTARAIAFTCRSPTSKPPKLSKPSGRLSPAEFAKVTSQSKHARQVASKLLLFLKKEGHNNFVVHVTHEQNGEEPVYHGKHAMPGSVVIFPTEPMHEPIIEQLASILDEAGVKKVSSLEKRVEENWLATIGRNKP